MFGLFESSAWYWISAYREERGAYRSIYSRGPMWLTDSAADEEFLDTVDALWDKKVFMWQWDGRAWQLKRGV